MIVCREESVEMAKFLKVELDVVNPFCTVLVQILIADNDINPLTDAEGAMLRKIVHSVRRQKEVRLFAKEG